MKSLKSKENNLLNRIYYNNFKKGVVKNTKIENKYNNRTDLEGKATNIEHRLNQLDNSLNINEVLKQINKTAVVKEKKAMLKSILRKHYFSESKMKPHTSGKV